MPEKFAFRFSSEYHDIETGLVYYNYRYYTPELGRWINKDPIGEDGGNGLYVACSNDLINDWDILGREGHNASQSYKPITKAEIQKIKNNVKITNSWRIPKTISLGSQLHVRWPWPRKGVLKPGNNTITVKKSDLGCYLKVNFKVKPVDWNKAFRAKETIPIYLGQGVYIKKNVRQPFYQPFVDYKSSLGPSGTLRGATNPALWVTFINLKPGTAAIENIATYNLDTEEDAILLPKSKKLKWYKYTLEMRGEYPSTGQRFIFDHTTFKINFKYEK
jgi:RHS repeat-associated protein